MQPSGAINLTNPGVTRANLTTVQGMAGGGTSVTTTYSYYDTGQPYTITDPCGNATCSDMTGANHTTTYSYADNYSDGTGTPLGQTHAYLTQVTRPNTGAAHVLHFLWGYSDGQIRSMTDENGQSTSYQYADPLARLTQISYPDTGTTTIAYNDSGFSSAGNTPNYTVTQSIAAGVAKTAETIFDGMGHTIHTMLTSDPDCGSGDRTDITYDGWARVQAVSNPYCKTNDSTYGITTTTFDALGRTVAVTRPDGNVVRTSYSGNQITATDEAGLQRRSYSDGLGRIVRVDEPGPGADSTGTPGSGTIVLSGSLYSTTTPGTPGSSATGQVVVGGAEQSKFFPAKTATGGSITISGVTSSTQSVSLGSAVTYNYSFPFSAPNLTGIIASAIAQSLQGSGLVTASVSGNTINFNAVTAGAAGNYQVSMSGFNGSAVGSTGGMDASTTYDTGTLSVGINGAVVSIPYGSGSTASSVASDLASNLSALGSLVNPTVNGGTIGLTASQQGPNWPLSTSTTWNSSAFPGPSFTINPSSANLTGGVYPIPAVTHYDSGVVTVTVGGFQASAAYDQNTNSAPTLLAGALANSLNAPNSPVTAAASGATIILTAKGVGSSTNYTVSGSSTLSFAASGTTLAGGTDPSGINAPYVTLYGYDVLNNLGSINQKGNGSDAARNRSFTYDLLSRLLTTTNPETGKILYSYDANGNVTTKTDNRGTVITNSYDELNRLIGTSFSDGKAPYLFSYDQSTFRGVSLSNTIGGLSSSSNNVNAGGASSYDTMGRVIYQTNCVPSNCSDNPNGIAAAYDLAGGLTLLTYPSGRHLTNTYNGVGRLTGVSFTDFNGATVNYPYVSAVHYAPTGMVKSMAYGNGVVDTVGYNNRLQPLNMLVSAGTQTFSHKAYSWSLNGANNGSVAGIADLLNGSRNQSFGYDALNRLTSGQADSFNQTYSYDAFGNLTQHGSPTGGKHGHQRNTTRARRKNADNLSETKCCSSFPPGGFALTLTIEPFTRQNTLQCQQG